MGENVFILCMIIREHVCYGERECGTWWWSLIARVSWGSQGCLVSGIFVGWHLVGGVDAKKRGTRSKGP